MKLKNTFPKIDPKNPFENDKLNRAYIADNLTSLIKTIEDEFVLSISSPWGTGKTTFINMWRQKLNNERIPNLYFNAWLSDYSDDPLLTFMAEINAYIKSNVKANKVKLKHFENAKDISFQIMKKSIPTLVKIATSGIVDIDSTLNNSISQLVEDIAKDKIANYESDKKSINSFKENLASFIESICVDDSGNRVPFVFFIDELDRCRPNYTIELLERIKHIFNVPGIVFVLSIDNEQIQNSIKSMYGLDMDVDGYLRRFIDLNYTLEKPSLENFTNNLFHKYKLDKAFQKREAALRVGRNEDASYFLNTFTEFATLFNLSPRVQEQCFAQSNIVVRTSPANQNIHPILLAFLITLKAFNKEFYSRFCTEQISSTELIKFIENQKGGSALLNTDLGRLTIANIEIAFAGWEDYSNLINYYRQKFAEDKLDDDKKYHYQRIKEIIQHLSSRHFIRICDFLYKRIEFGDQFDII